MKKRSPERLQTFRAFFLPRRPLYKMLSGRVGTGKIIMQKIHP